MTSVSALGIDRHLGEFPQLAHAVDPACATERLAAHFAAEYPNSRLEIAACRIERIDLTPGRSCKIRYRLTGKVGDHALDQWVHGRMKAGAEWTPAPSAAGTATTGAAGATPAFLHAATACAELGMTLRAFPHDRELPALPLLLDAAALRERVNEHRVAIGLPAGAEIRSIEIERLRYRPGKHCLLRYRVQAESGNDRRPHSAGIYSKAYAGDGGDQVFRVLRGLWEHPERPAALDVPRPIAHLPELGAVWYVDDLSNRWGAGGELALEPGPSRTLVEIAHLIARLHRLRGFRVRLRPARSASQLLDDARHDAAGIVRFIPAVATRIEPILARLAQTVPPPRRAPRAVLHGSFKLSQLRRAPDGRLGLVDFDGVRRGDPHHDLATFLASYHYGILRRGWSALSAHHGAEQFLGAYQRAVPWRCDGPRLAWGIAVCLLGKVHFSLKSLEWNDRAHAERALDLITQFTDGGRR